MIELEKTFVDILVSGRSPCSLEILDANGSGVDIWTFAEDVDQPKKRRVDQIWRYRIPDPRRVPELEKRVADLERANAGLKDLVEANEDLIAVLDANVRKLESEHREKRQKHSKRKRKLRSLQMWAAGLDGVVLDLRRRVEALEGKGDS